MQRGASRPSRMACTRAVMTCLWTIDHETARTQSLMPKLVFFSGEINLGKFHAILTGWLETWNFNATFLNIHANGVPNASALLKGQTTLSKFYQDKKNKRINITTSTPRKIETEIMIPNPQPIPVPLTLKGYFGKVKRTIARTIFSKETPVLYFPPSRNW